MAAPLVAGKGMNFIDNHRLDTAEDLATASGRNHEIQGFRSRDQYLGRPPDHPLALRLRRVAASHRRRDPWELEPHLGRYLPDLLERSVEIALYVVSQRFEGRYVEDFGACSRRLLCLARFVAASRDQLVNGNEKCGKRFARAG